MKIFLAMFVLAFVATLLLGYPTGWIYKSGCL